jgi:hypothetical protein
MAADELLTPPQVLLMLTADRHAQQSSPLLAADTSRPRNRARRARPVRGRPRPPAEILALLAAAALDVVFVFFEPDQAPPPARAVLARICEPEILGSGLTGI